MHLGAWVLVWCALEVGAAAGCLSRVLLYDMSLPLCALNFGCDYGCRVLPHRFFLPGVYAGVIPSNHNHPPFHGAG